MEQYFHYKNGTIYECLFDFIKQLFPGESDKKYTRRLTYYRKYGIYDKQSLFTLSKEHEGYNLPDEYEPWGPYGYYDVNLITLHIPDKYKHPELNDWYDRTFFDVIRQQLTY